MTWKERLVWSLPYVLVIVAGFGIEITEEIRFAIIAMVGMWFLPSPLTQFPQRVNVSRETSVETDTPNVSRETITAPCAVMHGSAELHVLGCDGWTSDQG